MLCIVFLAVAIGLINKAYVYKKDEMSGKELVMLIMPSLVGEMCIRDRNSADEIIKEWNMI